MTFAFMISISDSWILFQISLTILLKFMKVKSREFKFIIDIKILESFFENWLNFAYTNCIYKMNMKNVKKEFWEIDVEFIIIKSTNEIIDEKRMIEFKVITCWV